MPDVWFPNLHIWINNLPRVAFTVFGMEIYWYAFCVMAGYLAALITLRSIAKKTDQDPDIYSDFIIYCLIFGLIGARIYYVIFTFDSYRDNLWSIFATREGGLAIYGGLILTGLYAIYFVKKRKMTYAVLGDTSGPAIAIGQFFGRIGNLFNREAFGGYTDSLLAVRFRTDQTFVPAEMYDKILTFEGVQYIQVHPFFLYEMLWNLALFAFLIFYRKRKKFEGQIFLMYIIGYGFGRFMMEGMRTDKLHLFGTNLAVSQVLSALLAIGAAAVMVIGYKKSKGANAVENINTTQEE